MAKCEDYHRKENKIYVLYNNIGSVHYIVGYMSLILRKRLEAHVWNASDRHLDCIGTEMVFKSRDNIRISRKWVWRLKISENSVNGHCKKSKSENKNKKRNSQKRLSKRNHHCFIKKTSRIWLSESKGREWFKGKLVSGIQSIYKKIRTENLTTGCGKVKVAWNHFFF